jgi:hypothetical protein
VPQPQKLQQGCQVEVLIQVYYFYEILGARLTSKGTPSTESKRSRMRAAKEKLTSEVLADRPKDFEGFQKSWDLLQKFVDGFIPDRLELVSTCR